MALEDGAGVAKDLVASASAYAEACAREHDGACIESARMIWSGFGVPVDRERAYGILERLCARGDARACCSHGNLLLQATPSSAGASGEL